MRLESLFPGKEGGRPVAIRKPRGCQQPKLMLKGSILLRNFPYLLWAQHGDALQEAVVLVIIGHDDVALLLLRQHKLHVVLDVSSRFNESGIDVVGREVDDIKAVLKLVYHIGNLFV